ncbi:MAG: Ig-like domain-containing protein [Gemmatimonadales bacterium]
MQRLSPLGRLGAPLIALLVLARCGGSDLTLPSETAPAQLALVDGNNQSGPAGQPLGRPLVVQVIDRRGEPVRDQVVAFQLDTEAPGGAVTPDTITTGPDGKAQALWTLGSLSGAQRVRANVVGLDGLEVTFEAVVGSSAAARIELFGGDGQGAPVGTALGDSLVVRVLDQFGNPVAGVPVQWQADQGSVDPTSMNTGPDGHAATYRILGRSIGTQTTTASSAGLVGSPFIFSSTAVAGTADQLVRVSGNDQNGSPGAELSQPLVVRLVDQDGNGVSGRAVTWVVGAGGGSVSSINTTTGADGEAQTRWTLGSAGANTLNAVVSEVGVVTFSATAAGGGGGGGGGGPLPARLQFRVQPSDTREDQKIEPAVEVAVLDAAGDRFTGRDIEIKLEMAGSGNGELHGDPTRKTKSGVATFSDLRVNRPGEYELHASADGLATVVSTSFQIRDRHEGGDGHGDGHGGD